MKMHVRNIRLTYAPLRLNHARSANDNSAIASNAAWRKNLIWLVILSSLVSACAGQIDKLEQVGKPPAMSNIDSPTLKPTYQAMDWPLPQPVPPHTPTSNSLWQPGARAFFRDQRASRVGDILRINIKIRDKAELDNQTQRQRDSSDSVKAPEVFGLQRRIFSELPGHADVTNLANITGSTNTKGTGNTKREEKIETQVAATVTQILPNGNLVIDGKQEIRVNYEIREVSVSGVVRPEDIRSDNTIDSTQVAEARIIYGGRGQLSEVQQPRWGAQMLDILSPF